jgi:hypothetical protein
MATNPIPIDDQEENIVISDQDEIEIPSLRVRFDSLILAHRAMAADVENYSVFTSRLNEVTHPNFSYVPRWVYFYYIKVNAAGHLEVKHYLYWEKDAAGQYLPIPNDDAKLAAIAKDLADRARIGDDTYRLASANFQNVIWNKKKSYIMSFFDHARWNVHGRDDAREGVVFNDATPNFSFFDAKKLPVTLQGGDQRYVLSIINHMKRNAAGDDLLLNEQIKYKFDFVVDIGYSTIDAPPVLMILDPGGTNQGTSDAP